MRLALLLAAALAAGFPAPALATTVVPLSAERAETMARRVVEARVVAVHDVQVTGTEIAAAEYELAVERILKDDGSLARQVAQLNGIVRIRQVQTILGMPRYETGARYRLALNGDSVLGLTSPVGLGQGVALLEAAPRKDAP
jgi:hypothetical protein